jgi:hypothetical protein
MLFTCSFTVVAAVVVAAVVIAAVVVAAVVIAAVVFLLLDDSDTFIVKSRGQIHLSTPLIY